MYEVRPYSLSVNTSILIHEKAEVLGKRVVVQHIPVGGLLEWDDRFWPQTTELRMAPPSSSTHTSAPWAIGRSHLPHSISYTPAIVPTLHRPTRPVAPSVPSASTHNTGSLGPFSAVALPGSRFTQSVAAQEAPVLTTTPVHENDSAGGTNPNGSNLDER